jgi:hypothetical protein
MRGIPRIRILIFFALLVITLSQEVLSFAGIPLYYQRVVSRTLPEVSFQGQVKISNELVAANAAVRGMDLRAFAIYTIVTNLVNSLVYFGIAALILWKAQGEWFRWFTAFILVFIPGGGLFTFTLASQIGFLFVSTGSILWPLFLLYLYLFPNGKAVPSWTRWPMGFIVGIHLLFQVAYLMPNASILPPAFWSALETLGIPIIFSGFFLILFSQVYRYMRVSDQIERAQTRWVIVGLAIIVLSLLALPLVTGRFDVMNDGGYLGDISSLLMLLIPITIGISVLRFHLFDIDVIIRRTLQYSLITGILVLTYFGSVLLLQNLFTLAGGSRSPAIVVLSTLIIAALFTPIRLRVQKLIDRRFYRSNYDAARALNEFTQIVRDEVEFAQLESALLDVVRETFQPENAFLWIQGSKEIKG